MPIQNKGESPFSLLSVRITRSLLILKRAREKNGILLSIFKGVRLVFLRLARKARRFLYRRQYIHRTEELIQLIEKHDGFFDLLHIPVGWNTPMFQRYQHLSIQFARLGGFVLYGGHPDVDRELFVYQVPLPNLYVFDATDQILTKKILLSLQGKKQAKFVRIQSIDMQTTLSDIAGFLDLGFTVIYEYIDVISPVITGVVPDFVASRHLSLLEDQRILVIATADLLLADVRKHRSENYLLNTNGVDMDHWRIEVVDPPDDLKPLLASKKPVVGYHGALAEWIDYDLLWAIARTDKYELLLLGLEHDSSLKASGLAGHPAVSFLGSKSYFELNKYAHYYDVAILPFKKNQLTDSISPVKIFEYMAAQKPVVTTDLLECTKYAGCLVARSTVEFLEKLDLANTLKADPQYLSLLDMETQNNSWQQKVVDILKFVGVIPESINTSR